MGHMTTTFKCFYDYWHLHSYSEDFFTTLIYPDVLFPPKLFDLMCKKANFPIIRYALILILILIYFSRM